MIRSGIPVTVWEEQELATILTAIEYYVEQDRESR